MWLQKAFNASHPYAPPFTLLPHLILLNSSFHFISLYHYILIPLLWMITSFPLVPYMLF